ncbi:phosphatidylinositol [Echinococcus multilocularis]|uniref:Phosphatidylinositol n=1 Tax=Echinococcus multilocularis TaxID=6211 RepID=A0A0S4MLE0_ECHMU|nr:phosphatidylinositol [Echinococcus multilocularis]
MGITEELQWPRGSNAISRIVTSRLRWLCALGPYRSLGLVQGMTMAMGRMMECICIILVEWFKPSIHAMYVIGTFTEAASLELRLALLTVGCYAFSNVSHLPIFMMEKRAGGTFLQQFTYMLFLCVLMPSLISSFVLFLP